MRLTAGRVVTIKMETTSAISTDTNQQLGNMSQHARTQLLHRSTTAKLSLSSQTKTKTNTKTFVTDKTYI